MRLRSHLLLLSLLTVLPLAIAAVAAMEERLPWLVIVGISGTLCFAVLLPLAFARRISASLAALARMAKALAAGTPAEPEAKPSVREIAQASEQLASAALMVRSREKSLRDADRAKDEFVAMLSHELRNPLGALAAAAQVLRKTGLQQGPAAEASEVVARQVEHMRSLSTTRWPRCARRAAWPATRCASNYRRPGCAPTSRAPRKSFPTWSATR
jgi:signal transduction histidine kinase